MSEYRFIPGFEPAMVSEFGTIISASKKILKPTLGKRGYLVARPNGRKLIKVHRAVALAFLPNPDNHPYVNHKDFNKLNNSFKNLEWCSPAQNVKHTVNHNRHVRGSNVMFSKLDSIQVKVIKKCILEGIKQVDLAKYFGVKFCTINNIHKGRSWGHVS